jgi:hypothetical protein
MRRCGKGAVNNSWGSALPVVRKILGASAVASFRETTRELEREHVALFDDEHA